MQQTDIHFWSYLAQFFLEWEMFQTEFIEKIKTHVLCSVTFSRKSYRLWDNVEKYCTVGQATGEVAHACWITKVTNTHSEYVTLLFHYKNSWTKAPQYYVTRTLAVLLNIGSYWNHISNVMSGCLQTKENYKLRVLSR